MAPSKAQCQNFATVGFSKANNLTVHTANGSMICCSVQRHSSSLNNTLPSSLPVTSPTAPSSLCSVHQTGCRQPSGQLFCIRP
jgi:hypothetical protein